MVADQAFFIKALGNSHGELGREMQFFPGFLLKGWSGERGQRAFSGFFLLNIAYPVTGAISAKVFNYLICFCFCLNTELWNVVFIYFRKQGFKFVTPFFFQQSFNIPIFFGHEVFYFHFSFSYQSDRNWLDPARR